MELHQKQFVVSAQKHHLNSKWRSISVGNGLHISYCSKLPVKTLNDCKGNIYYLLGWPVLLENNFKNEYAGIQEIESDSHKWAGRWCLIGKDQIFSDASNLICLVYDKSCSYLASSPVLLNSLLNKKSPDYDLQGKYYHNWFIVPGTAYSNIFKMFPGEKAIRLKNSWGIRYRQLELNYRFDSYEDLYNDLSESFLNEVSYLVLKLKLKPLVALSGGYDSRLILAIASTVKKDVRSYTHVFPSMKISDYKIPKAISSENLFIKPSVFKKNLQTLFDQHSGIHARDADRFFFSHQQWQSFNENQVCLRGGILELAGESSAHLYERLPDLKFQNEEDTRIFNYALSDFRNFQIQATKKYATYCSNHPLRTHFHKKYYLDQRIGGWLSYIEQSLTLAKPLSHNLGNSIYQINLMKSIPSNMMSVKGFHLDFIRRNAPSLLNFPFNSSSKVDKIKALLNSKINSFLLK
ncbi:hypothetical protein [Robiginitalea aurantiaca]|uniref:Asparagine synthetase domain-containing protein n=1 Tax=Robiginitalea aurantiaca TaxID=3056915 RepID=A0ABT7WDZ4_9FLAO|nr:hypothetical protein [Robiginitalea aurantiaca]MDM9631143.1 hypothetical protein [Robiginitalea aurantiaca]